jgi:hypothetical protein
MVAMSKRKSYEERLIALNKKAKEDIRQMFAKHNITSLDIPEGVVNVTSQHPGGHFDIFPVYEIELVPQEKPHEGSILCFDYRGGIAWYQNPVAWCQVADAVRKILKKR